MMDGNPQTSLDTIERVVSWLADTGWTIACWGIAQRYLIAIASTVAASVAFIVSRRDRGGAWRLFASLAAGVWAQSFLLSDSLTLGFAFYLLSFHLAAHFGRDLPLASIAPSEPKTYWPDGIAVVALSGLALLTRLYAIDELPNFVDIEPTDAFLRSLTLHGVLQYVEAGRVRDDGFVHMLTRAASLKLIDSPVVAIRCAAVFWGTVAVPLCYVLVRRLAGRFAACIAALLFVSAPEQLFWSRIEATQLSCVAAATLVTLLLGIWVSDKGSISSVAAAALWMPITRFFYAAAVPLFLLPVTVGSLGLMGKKFAGRARTVTAILAFGLGLWFFSSSLLHLFATQTWAYVPSTHVYGNPVYEPFGTDDRFDAFAAIDFQAARVLRNAARLAMQLGYDRDSYSHWYQQEHPDGEHMRMVHAALLVSFVVGLGYLSAQWRDGRAATLLAAVGLGLLPGLLSDDPEPRRVAVLYPVIVTVAAVVVALLRSRATGGKRNGAVATTAIVAVIALILSTNLAAHFRLERRPLLFQSYIRFLQPYFESDDVIYHNIDDRSIAEVLVFGNARAFQRRSPCLRRIDDWDREWSDATREFFCDFSDPVYPLILSDDSIEELRGHNRPRRVTYVIRVRTNRDRRILRKLRDRFAHASISKVRSNHPSDPVGALFALSISVPSSELNVLFVH
jgi:hypothetical protein